MSETMKPDANEIQEDIIEFTSEKTGKLAKIRRFFSLKRIIILSVILVISVIFVILSS